MRQHIAPFACRADAFLNLHFLETMACVTT
jgi:hypothetical protein